MMADKKTMTADEFCRWVENLGQRERDEVNMAASYAIWAAGDDEDYPDDIPIDELRSLIHDRQEQLHGRMAMPAGTGSEGQDREPTQREELLEKLVGTWVNKNTAETIVDQLIAPLVWEVGDAVFDCGDLTQKMAELGWQPIPGSGSGGKKWTR